MPTIRVENDAVIKPLTATAFTFCEAFSDIQWKTTGFRRKSCAGIISGDRLVRVCTLLGIRKTCREKSAKVGKKGVQERGVQRGKPKGEKEEGMPIFVGFN